MTGLEFVTYVKAKLNRIDTSAYEDVRPEEIYFFGHEALKKLTLEFDTLMFSRTVTNQALLVYLASVTKTSEELTVTNNLVTLPELLKLKDVAVYVEVDEEKGWMPTREVTNVKSTGREEDPFRKSYPDEPTYRLIEDKIKFDTQGFDCTKVKLEYLEYPAVIGDGSNLDFVFKSELENTTVTLILETLESRRLQSQPAISKS